MIYDNYDFCVTVSLGLTGNVIEYKCNDLQFSRNNHSDYSIFYDKEYRYSDDGNVSESHLNTSNLTRGTINNIEDKIYDLYTQTIQDRDIDFSTDIEFHAVANYFDYCFDNICRKYDVPLEKLYFVFIIPNQWSMDKYITHGVMKQLLEASGIVFTPDTSDRALFITKLEAAFLDIQLGTRNRKRMMTKFPFLQNENRCLLFDILVNENTLNLQSTYFTLKRNDAISESNREYYIPQIESISDSPPIDDINALKTSLESLIIQELNKHTETYRSHAHYETITTYIMDVIFGDMNEYRDEEKDFDFEKFVHYDDDLLEEYLDEGQIAHMKTNTFFENIFQGFLVRLNSEYSSIVDFFHEEKNNIKLFKKSIIVNECFQNDDMDWFRFVIAAIFFRVYRGDPHESYRRIEKKQWYFIKDGLYDYNVTLGGFFKASQKAMNSNISSVPTVITEERDPHPMIPKKIVYIGIFSNSTSAVCEVVDNEGHCQHQYDIGIQMPLEEKKKFREIIAHGNQKIALNGRRFELSNMKLSFANHLRRFIQLVNLKLEEFIRNPLDAVGYVISVDKLMMEALDIQSNDDLQQHFKDSNVVELDDGHWKIIIADLGEKALHDTILQDFQLEPTMNSIHVNIDEECMYFKLHRAVDIMELNRQIPRTIFIKSKLIKMQNIYKQMSDLFWHNLQSLELTDRVRFLQDNPSFADIIDDPTLFNERISRLFKEELFCCDQTEPDMADSIQAAVRNFGVPIQQLMIVSIIPVFMQLVTIIMSCINSLDGFGHFEINNLFITSTYLNNTTQNNVIFDVITANMKIKFMEFIKNTTNRTKLYMSIHSTNTSLDQIILQRSSFCFDLFLNGQLRMVADKTHYIYIEQHSQDVPPTIKITGNPEVLKQGDELTEKVLTVMGDQDTRKSTYLEYRETQQDARENALYYKNSNPFDYSYSEDSQLDHYDDDNGISIRISLEKYDEGSNTIGTANKVIRYELSDITTLHHFVIIQVQPLHHLFCIQVTCENYFIEDGEIDSYTTSCMIGERPRLRYFYY